MDGLLTIFILANVSYTNMLANPVILTLVLSSGQMTPGVWESRGHYKG